MRFRRILEINSLMLIGCGLLMVIPALVDIITQNNIWNAFILSSLSTLVIGFLIYLFVSVAWWNLKNPLILGVLVLDLLSVDVIWSICFTALIFKLFPRKRTFLSEFILIDKQSPFAW